MQPLPPGAITFGLHGSLVIPIAARSQEAIEKYIGPVTTSFSGGEALIVSFQPGQAPNDLPVWQLERSALLHQQQQLWVDVESKKYKAFYAEYFAGTNASDVIDHIMNRRLARRLGYKYTRLLHISRGANSSSGRGGESLAVDYSSLSMELNPELNQCDIIYADPADLAKMLGLKTGGFGLETVAEHHHLFYQ